MGTGIRNIKEYKILKNILERKGALSALIIYCKDMHEVSVFQNRKQLCKCLDEQTKLNQQKNFQFLHYTLSPKETRLQILKFRKRKNKMLDTWPYLFKFFFTYFCIFVSIKSKQKVDKYYAFYVKPDYFGTNAFSHN